MATKTISTKLAVEGEAAYRQGVASCNAELKTLKSNLALVESEFRNNANSMAALTAKGNALSAVYDKQLEKVVKLETALLNAQNAVATYTEKQADLKAKLDASSQAVGDLDETSKKSGKQWADYADELEKSETALEALKRKSGDTSAEQAKLESTIAQVRTKMEQLETSTGGAAKQAGELLQQNKQLNTAYADNKARLAAASRGVQDWQSKLNSAKIELNGLSDKIEQNNKYLREAEESADNCATSIDKYGKEVKEAGKSSEEFADGADKSKQGIEQLAAALAAAGVAKTVKEITDELLECAGAAAGFETALAKLSTLIDTSVYPMEDIKVQLVELSNETGVSVSALTEAAYQARSAGVDAANVISFVSTATKTSVAGFTDSATAVDVLTTALNAYKLEGTEAERVASMLVRTQDEGKTSVGQLAQNMGRIIPVAAAYNVSLGNLTTSYALLTKNGMNTAIATTNLTAMLTELAKDGSDVSKILREETGQSFSELMDLGQTLGGVMEILAASVDGDATAFSNLWSSSTASQAALSLLNSGAEEYNRTLSVMENSSGAVDRNFQTMADTAEFAQQRMTNAAENLRIAVGDQLNPALENLYEAGANAFTWATDFVEKNPWIVSAITGITVALGTLVAGMTAATVGAGALKAALDLLKAHPLVLVAAAAAGLAAAVAALKMPLDDASESAGEFSQALRESKEAYEDLIASIEKEQANTAAQARSLKDLLAVEEKSAAQKDQIRKRVDKLNEAMPDLTLAYDEATDSILNMDDGLEMTIEDIEAMIERAAGLETYNAQLERVNELQDKQEEIRAQLKDATEQLTAAEEKAAQMGDANAEDREVQSFVVAKLKRNVEELTAAQEANAAELAELEAATDAYADRQAKAASDTESFSAAVRRLETAQANLQAAYDESRQKALDSLNTQMGLFEQMDGKAKTSIDNLIKTLQGQVEYMDNYATNIQKALEMGVDEGLVKALSDGRQESAQQLDAIVKGTEAEITKLNEEFAKSEKAKETLSSVMADMEHNFSIKMDEMSADLRGLEEEMDRRKEWFQVFANNVQGGIEGFKSKLPDLVALGKEMFNATHGTYLKESDQHSPSKKFETAGKNDVQGLIIGTEGWKSRLAAAYEGLAELALASYAKGVEKNWDKVIQAMAQYDASLKDLGTFYDLKAEVGDLEYQLWEKTYGKNVSEVEKYAKQLDLLEQKQADQAEIVKAAAAAYETAVAQYGEGSAGSYEYQKALLEEELALQDLRDEIERVTEAKKELARQDAQVQMELAWASSGLGRAQAVANSTGYITPYEVSQIAGTNLVLPNGRDYAVAYEEATQQMLTASYTHLPSTLEVPSSSGALEQQMEAMTADMVNAIAGLTQGGGSGIERVRIVTVDSKVLAEFVFDDLIDYGNSNGTLILNPPR